MSELDGAIEGERVGALEEGPEGDGVGVGVGVGVGLCANATGSKSPVERANPTRMRGRRVTDESCVGPIVKSVERGAGQSKRYSGVRAAIYEAALAVGLVSRPGTTSSCRMGSAAGM